MPTLNEASDNDSRSLIQRLISWAQNLFALLILIGFAWYIWGHRSLFFEALELDVFDALLIAALILVTWVISGTQSLVLFRAAGCNIGFWESCTLTVASGFGNYLPMRAGTIVKAHYMKSVHNMTYTRFASVFGIRLLLTLIASGLIGLCGTLAIAHFEGRVSIELMLIFLVSACTPCLAYFWEPDGSRAVTGRIGRVWRNFSDGFKQLKEQPTVGLISLVLILLQYIVLGARFYIASAATGGEVSVALISLLVPLAVVSSFAALTPGGLGVREAIMGYATFAVGMPFSQGIFVGTIDRGILLLMIAAFGSMGFLWLWSNIRNVEVEGLVLDEGPE